MMKNDVNFGKKYIEVEHFGKIVFCELHPSLEDLPLIRSRLEKECGWNNGILKFFMICVTPDNKFHAVKS